VATVLGTLLVLAGAYMVVVENDEPSSSGPTAPKVSIPPRVTNDAGIPEGYENFFEGATAADGSHSVTASSDPLKIARRDSRIVNVTITLTSDGPMKYAYRTREGPSAPQSANRTASVSLRLRGPTPVAQAFVQLIDGSTYATCTITIDGERVSRATAKKMYQVVACTG
jgi:hypothetical protein